MIDMMATPSGKALLENDSKPYMTAEEAQDMMPRNGASTLEKSQAFFSGLAAEIRKPSYGDQHREFVRALLIRAQEAELYSPELP